MNSIAVGINICSNRYLAHRRAGILATVIVAYLTQGEKPNRSVATSAALVTVGAAIAGYESLAVTTRILDLVLVWANNFSQSLQVTYVNKHNKAGAITPFGKSLSFELISTSVVESTFYFASSGVIVGGIYTFILTDRYMEWVTLATDPEGGTLFSLLMAASAFYAAIFTLTMLIVVRVSGPLMINITGTTRDIILTYLGYVLFDGSVATATSLIGMAFGFAGAIHHMHYKFSNAPKNSNIKVEESKKEK